ncbi:GMC family oxidoreductase [Nocardioides maradonensis]
MSENQREADVLVVGGGLMGAAVTRLLREASPDIDIVMVDAGPDIGSIPGQHLHDSPEPEIWARYNEMMASGIQSFYVGAFDGEFGDSWADALPGMYAIGQLGEDADEMPGAALGWNAGGMSVHWSAATPSPPADEVPDFIPPAEWAADLERAKRLLRVHEGPYEKSDVATAMRARLNEVLAADLHPERPVRDMPMALQPRADGLLERTGPNVVLPAISSGDDPRFERHASCQAHRLELDGDRVVGAWVRRLGEETETLVRARVTVVCADAMRTPQLLFASGVRPAALGRHLNEHATLSGQTLVDLEALGVFPDAVPAQQPGEYAVAQYWVPPNGDVLPGMGQICDIVYRDDDDAFLAYGCGLSFYVRTDVDPENRLEFLEDETDGLDMPRIRVHFRYSSDDLARIERVREVQHRIGRAMGTFDPEKDSGMLAPGASLHFTGTVRMGPVDDGTSVCDVDGAVWGTEDLYVAGNGVIPTAITCNSTLTGMVTAVRTARAVLARLTSGGSRG